MKVENPFFVSLALGRVSYRIESNRIESNLIFWEYSLRAFVIQ